MRLLHTRTLTLKSFTSTHAPDFVILSHRWLSQNELTFEDVTKIGVDNTYYVTKPGFPKVRNACNQAIQDGYDWIWIDSCCMDRSSSAELQESVNSMWNYYSSANICYVYLADVSKDASSSAASFAESAWWSRGWTLQELLAPTSVEFYAEDWTFIGTRAERCTEIATITQISESALSKSDSIDAFSAAEKFSWAAHRQVTREEDESYALLGLFQVNIPLLYGEGKVRAFARLQEAIYTATTDMTMFLFRYSLHSDAQPLLADCPTRFCQRSSCDACSSHQSKFFPLTLSYNRLFARDIWTKQAHENLFTTVTPFRYEVSTTLQLLEYDELVAKKIRPLVADKNGKKLPDNVTHVAVLNYTLDRPQKSALCLLLRQNSNDGDAFLRISSFPFLISRVEEMENRLRSRKVLVCLGGNLVDKTDLVSVTFIFAGHACKILKWTAENVVSEDRAASEADQSFKITTTRIADPIKTAHVSVDVLIQVSAAIKIRIEFARFNATWSIGKLSELYPKRHGEQYQTLRANLGHTDRCAVVLSQGNILTISLRRMAASDADALFRYRIALSL